MNQGKIKFLPEFFLCLSVCLLIVPFKWLLCWLAAAVLHELFHILALKICRFQVISASLGAMGAKIETDAEKGLKSMICALAGPLAGVLLLLFIRKIPMIALCGLFQSAANLLPIYPLDGGRVLDNLLFLIFPAYIADKILWITERMIWIFLLSIALYGFIKFRFGILPVFTVAMLFLRKKYLAKGAKKRYNIPIRN